MYFGFRIPSSVIPFNYVVVLSLSHQPLSHFSFTKCDRPYRRHGPLFLTRLSNAHQRQTATPHITTHATKPWIRTTNCPSQRVIYQRAFSTLYNSYYPLPPENNDAALPLTLTKVLYVRTSSRLLNYACNIIEVCKQQNIQNLYFN
jgi:hypothetical protein